ncbi:M23 family metallopeptidase [bacterium]|nr:M23 family metallopeptidase [bacterium]
MKKRYLISLVETSSHKAFSLVLSPLSASLLIAAIIVLFSLVAWPVSIYLHNADEQHLIQQFHQENQTLKITLHDYHQRLVELEDAIDEMMAGNPYFQTLAESSNGMLAQYGVGGPSSGELHTIKDAMLTEADNLALNKLERQVSSLKYRISTLDTTMAMRMSEIAHYPSIRPARTGWTTSGYGNRLDPFTGKMEHHPGLDISMPVGSAVYATADGVVKEVRTHFINNKSYGKFIVIDHGFGYRTLYAHLSKIMVKKGQRIERWDLIAHSGNTGKSTAPHLHYGVYAANIAQDPLHFILE